jgi:hypothetical protein
MKEDDATFMEAVWKCSKPIFSLGMWSEDIFFLDLNPTKNSASENIFFEKYARESYESGMYEHSNSGTTNAAKAELAKIAARAELHLHMKSDMEICKAAVRECSYFLGVLHNRNIYSYYRRYLNPSVKPWKSYVQWWTTTTNFLGTQKKHD